VTKRACKGTTRAHKPCGANPLKPGTVIEGVTVSGQWCRQHDLDLPDSARIGGATPGAGRKPKPTPTEIARNLVEKYELALQRPYWLALGYDVRIGEDGPELVERADGGAKLFGESKDGEIRVSSHEDLGAMIAAAEKLWDRVYGKARQRNEVTVVTKDAFAQMMEQLEAEVRGNEDGGDRGGTGGDRALPGAPAAS
jgi:hypothetical protein